MEVASLSSKQVGAAKEMILDKVVSTVNLALSKLQATIIVSNFPSPSHFHLGIADQKQACSESEFYAELNLVTSEIKNKLVHEDDFYEKKSMITLERREELFDALKEALKTKRPKNSQQIIEELNKYELSSSDNEIFLEVKKLIKKYKFKDIESLLENI